MDTDQDKSLEEIETEGEPAKADVPLELEDDEEEQPITEETVEEELIEEAKPTEEEAEAEAEEAEEEAEKEEKREEEIVEERIYTIPLGRAWISPRKKRAPRAVRIVKSFIQRHMKIEQSVDEAQGRLVISNEVNEKLWSRGTEKPPRKIRVRAVKDTEGIVTLYLA